MNVQIEQGAFGVPTLTASVPYPVKPVGRGKPKLGRPRTRRKGAATSTVVIKARQTFKQEFKQEDDDEVDLVEVKEEKNNDVLSKKSRAKTRSIEEEIRLFPVEQIKHKSSCKHVMFFKEKQRGTRKYRKMLKMIFGLAASKKKDFQSTAENKVCVTVFVLTNF